MKSYFKRQMEILDIVGKKFRPNAFTGGGEGVAMTGIKVQLTDRYFFFS